MPKEYPVCVSCLIFVADVSDHAAWIADSHAVGRDGTGDYASCPDDTVAAYSDSWKYVSRIHSENQCLHVLQRFACNTFFIFRLHT